MDLITLSCYAKNLGATAAALQIDVNSNARSEQFYEILTVVLSIRRSLNADFSSRITFLSIDGKPGVGGHWSSGNARCSGLTASFLSLDGRSAGLTSVGR